MTTYSGRKRALLLAATTGYQTRMFAEAAEHMGVDLVYATDRCDQLEDPWQDDAIPVRFHEEWRSVDVILKAAEQQPFDAILAVGDRPTVLAAQVARQLGLPHHPPEAAAASRDKRLMRAKLKSAGLPVPAFTTVPVATDICHIAHSLNYPAVIKPTVLSASRGVIRVDDPASLATAFGRVRRLLSSPEIRELRDPEADVVQIEDYIPGQEYAVEAMLEHGQCRILAIFDKPDPMDGPFFEETIYVTPSRAPEPVQAQIAAVVANAAAALGLYHGPIHAECRVNARGVFILEIAARPIGGLCAKALRFERNGLSISFEQLLLGHALREPTASWQREPHASAVMMVPIPKSGVFRRVAGVDAARGVAHVKEIHITAKADQRLLALPEGASYLGFIFARAERPADAEHAVREAHARLRFTIDPLLEVIASG